MKRDVNNIIEQIYETTVVRAFEFSNTVLKQYEEDRDEARKWLESEVVGLEDFQISEILHIVQLKIEKVSNEK